MSERIMIKTSGMQKIIGYKALCKFEQTTRNLVIYAYILITEYNTRSLTYYS